MGRPSRFGLLPRLYPTASGQGRSSPALAAATRLIVGFQYDRETRRFWDELRERLAAYGLELHPDKTDRVHRQGRRKRGLDRQGLAPGGSIAASRGPSRRPHAQELLEVLLDEMEQGRLPRPPRPVDSAGDLHAPPRAGQVRGETPAKRVDGPSAYAVGVCPTSMPGQVRSRRR